MRLRAIVMCVVESACEIQAVGDGRRYVPSEVDGERKKEKRNRVYRAQNGERIKSTIVTCAVEEAVATVFRFADARFECRVVEDGLGGSQRLEGFEKADSERSGAGPAWHRWHQTWSVRRLSVTRFWAAAAPPWAGASLTQLKSPAECSCIRA